MKIDFNLILMLFLFILLLTKITKKSNQALKPKFCILKNVNTLLSTILNEI